MNEIDVPKVVCLKMRAVDAVYCRSDKECGQARNSTVRDIALEAQSDVPDVSPTSEAFPTPPAVCMVVVMALRHTKPPTTATTTYNSLSFVVACCKCCNGFYALAGRVNTAVALRAEQRRPAPTLGRGELGIVAAYTTAPAWARSGWSTEAGAAIRAVTP